MESPTVRSDRVCTPFAAGSTYGDCELLGPVTWAAAGPAPTRTANTASARTGANRSVMGGYHTYHTADGGRRLGIVSDGPGLVKRNYHPNRSVNPCYMP